MLHYCELLLRLQTLFCLLSETITISYRLVLRFNVLELKNYAIFYLDEMTLPVYKGAYLLTSFCVNRTAGVGPGSTKFKQERDAQRKAAEANGNTQAWNPLFMRPDTVSPI